MLALSRFQPGGAGGVPGRGARAGAAALAAITFLALAPAAWARGAPDSFADLAAKVTPAVVNISTEIRRTVSGAENLESMMPDVPRNSPFYELFRQFRQRMAPHTERTRALGSGFIVDASGYVVTNNHVIEGADEITVTLQDGRKYKANLVGRDPKTDVALLKFDGPTNLTAVEWGNSDAARVGDWVLAVGNPFGLGGTVTAGIISARNRDIRSGPYDDYLQVDAPINKGNSGGPLFDMDGRVLGINTAIYSPNGGSIGIGFAIPASIAKPVVEQLRAHGRIERGWLGVSVQAVNDDLARALGLPRTAGALVAQVQDGSPAAKAGFRTGDVIIGVEGKAVEQSRDLPRLVAGLKRGARAEFNVWRDGKETTLSAEIGRQPEEAAARTDNKSGESRLSYGIALAPLTPEARAAYDIPPRVEGVLIASVAPGSAAAERGLRAGDVILRVGNERVADVDSAVEKLDRAKASGKPVMLLISRRGETLFVAIRAGRA